MKKTTELIVVAMGLRVEVMSEVVLEDSSSANFVRSSDLAARMAEASQTRISRQYVARHGETEVGFTTLDHHLNHGILVLYELFVLPQFRRRGFGRAIVRAAERFAVQHSYSLMRVKPHPLESSISQETLRQFYASEGFVAISGSNDMQKEVCGPTHYS